MKDNKYYAINWTDGVKISKDHFTESYFNTVDTIRDRVKLNTHSYDYGLLLPTKETKDPLVIKTIAHSDNRLVLELQSCYAITKGGCKIEFSRDSYKGNLPTATIESSETNSDNTEEYYIVISVNPFNLVPVGEPDPEVIPLHHPYVLPKIDLKILPKRQFTEGFFETHYLIVGQIDWKNGVFVIDKDFIPPVCRIEYNNSLKSFNESIGVTLKNLKDNSIKIHKKNRDKAQNNPLVRNTFLLCAKMLDFTSQYSFEFNQIGNEQPPIFIIQRVSVLANYFSNLLVMMEVSEKEKLLQYFYEWIDIKPSVFESSLTDIIGLNYDHQDIREMKNKVNVLLGILSKLWTRLSDLEYIGQRKDNIVISEESTIMKSTPKNKSWSIID